ncbi:uncharacterized protein LOC107863749 isoform X1 [Capsicum annuum]|uniref:uncharacterized protein LOC107863749 isoform X1 n=1 Tax=Capsicum annuum TaxID=4072 RepID=UPI001FB1981B|nr:uncharacterized protein LOC107863749 isoform X1 [Capsicum annuum]
MQKGLIDVVGQLFPKAHHRWCVGHKEANWAKTWRGGELKKLMWWSAWSIYTEEFEDQLKNMGSASEQAVKDLLWYPSKHWCRAYFDTVWKNFTCENNFTESFNKWILELQVGNEERIHVYYAHGEVSATFVRRCYWLLDKSMGALFKKDGL